MNAQFASYATSKAFTFSMTKTQADALSSIHWHLFSYDVYGCIGSLLRRGLIEPIGRVQGGYHTYYRCTKAGDLMYQLLEEAGLAKYIRPPMSKWEIPDVVAKYRYYWEPLPKNDAAPAPKQASSEETA